MAAERSNHPHLRIFWRLLGFLRPYRWSLAVSIVLAVGSQASSLGLIRLTQSVIDDAIRPRDERMLLILVGVIAAVRDRSLVEETAAVAERPAAWHTLLLVSLGDGRRLALPLSQVARLEEVPREAVERASGQQMIQYRGQILPLVRLADLLPNPAPAAPAGAEDPIDLDEPLDQRGFACP